MGLAKALGLGIGRLKLISILRTSNNGVNESCVLALFRAYTIWN